MKEKEIFDALTQLDDDLVEKARVSRLERKQNPWKKWMAVAASIILVLAVGRIVVMNVPFVGSTGGNSGGRNEGSVFMSYAGPVFPLTLDEDNVQISTCLRMSFQKSNIWTGLYICHLKV